jgi:hypothetical protein
MIATPPPSVHSSAFVIDIWGNFIVRGDPGINLELACGKTCTRKPTYDTNIARSWKSYNHQSHSPIHLVVNVTGGTPGECSVLFVGNASCNNGLGVVNDFRVADAGAPGKGGEEIGVTSGEKLDLVSSPKM